MSVTPDQFGEWIDRWAAPLASWLRGRCACPEDIVQEAFCRLVQQKQTPERIAAWLFRVAGNLAREERRKGTRRKRREQCVSVSEAAQADPSGPSEQNELRDYVNGLGVELREVVIARLWADLTFTEISELLGISVSSVYRRYEIALQELRQKYDEPSVSIRISHDRRAEKRF